MTDGESRHRGLVASGIFALLVLVMALVFARVLDLRFSSGDVYPHYSSLRSDPLGTQAFYQALDSMESYEVSRSLRPLTRIENVARDSTVVLLGVPRTSLAWIFVSKGDPLIEAVRNGARLVVAVNPGLVPQTSEQSEIEWWQRHQRIRRARKGSGSDETDQKDLSEASLLRFFGAGLEVPEKFDRPEEGWEVVNGTGSDSMNVPLALPDWYSHCRLSDLEPQWTIVGKLAENGAAVVAERKFGQGSVVVTSDAYFASNEALWQGADSEFLLWLIGDRKRVIFDESIHGAQQTTGVMQWMLRYRLHGFFIGLVVVVGLLAWRSGSSLVPKRQASDLGIDGESGAIAGEAADDGLVRLLRRGVKPSSLLRRCVNLWRESSTSMEDCDSSSLPSKEIETLLDEAANPVEGYRAIVAMLRRRRS